MDFYHCKECELVYLERDTHEYYAPGFPTHNGARGCPVDGSKLTLMGGDEVDLGVVDYLAGA